MRIQLGQLTPSGVGQYSTKPKSRLCRLAEDWSLGNDRKRSARWRHAVRPEVYLWLCRGCRYLTLGYLREHKSYFKTYVVVYDYVITGPVITGDFFLDRQILYNCS